MLRARENWKKTLAVFDVDETLIYVKSMFSFYQFCLMSRGGPSEGVERYAEFQRRFDRQRQIRQRNELNRLFFEEFKGWDAKQLEILAMDWFEVQINSDGFLIPEVLARLRRHQTLGHDVMLLSGSLKVIIDALAKYLKVPNVRAISLAIDETGCVTGDIDGVQTIGMGKAAVLEEYVGQTRQQTRLVGYGDHESDQAYLMMCDNIRVVAPFGAVTTWQPEWPRLYYMPI